METEDNIFKISSYQTQLLTNKFDWTHCFPVIFEFNVNSEIQDIILF